MVDDLKVEGDPSLQEHCDFCLGKRGEHGRYLFHNQLRTETICNFCVIVLHERMLQLDLLMKAPTGAAN